MLPNMKKMNFLNKVSIMKLKRLNRFEVDEIIISQFQLDISNRHQRRIKTIVSEDGRKLKYQYTDLSGYITLYGEDVEEIVVLLK